MLKVKYWCMRSSTTILNVCCYNILLGSYRNDVQRVVTHFADFWVLVMHQVNQVSWGLCLLNDNIAGWLMKYHLIEHVDYLQYHLIIFLLCCGMNEHKQMKLPVGCNTWISQYTLDSTWVETGDFTYYYFKHFLNVDHTTNKTDCVAIPIHLAA